MKYTFLFLFLLLMGCSGTTPGQYANFWTQCIKFNGIGISGLTAYGPWNVGYITYERNVECKKDINPQPLPVPPIGYNGMEFMTMYHTAP